MTYKQIDLTVEQTALSGLRWIAIGLSKAVAAGQLSFRCRVLAEPDVVMAVWPNDTALKLRGLKMQRSGTTIAQTLVVKIPYTDLRSATRLPGTWLFRLGVDRELLLTVDLLEDGLQELESHKHVEVGAEVQLAVT
jgi:hypothetical protein